MQIQLVRSATVRFHYANHNFLVDPYLAPRFSRPPYAGKSRNPLVDLPFSPEAALIDIEMILISHLHSDHFDPDAEHLLPCNFPLLCQPVDLNDLGSRGFTDVTAVNDSVEWNGISIVRTPCRHGSGQVLDEMGIASGFLFRSPNEPIVYWCGDTILFEGVLETIENNKPDIIITHSCGAMWGKETLIVMDAAQTIELFRAAGNAIVIATHMDSVDHATVSRKDLLKYASSHQIGSSQLLIPEDGEILGFPKVS